MLVSRLIPLVVMAGIGAHSGGAIKERLTGAVTARDKLVTKQRMMAIMEAIRMDAATNEEPVVFKTPAELRVFIKRNVRLRGSGDPSVDFWGVPFRSQPVRSGLTLMSAGPDKTFGTKDDVKSTEDIYNF